MRLLAHGVAAFTLLFASPVAAQSAIAPAHPGAMAGLAEKPGATRAEEIAELPGPAEVEAPSYVRYGHGILITGTPQFMEETTRVLDELALLPTGASILEAIGEDEHSTVITEFSRANATVRPLVQSELSEGLRNFWGRPGPGTAAHLTWNPSFEPEGYSLPVIMGHELIHALYLNRGEWTTRVRFLGPNRGTRLDELITIGTDGYEDEELTENQLRQEWNELYPERAIPPHRYGHGGSDFEPPQRGWIDPLHPILEQAQPLVRPDTPRGRSAGLTGALEARSGGPQ